MTERGPLIPAEAVEAAAEELHDREGYTTTFEEGPNYRREYYREVARAALEAAAPHMLTEVTAKLDALEKLLQDMEQQPPSEIGTIRGMAGIIRNELRTTA
jgi:molecular chaperone GrpE (heat shock protein)